VAKSLSMLLLALHVGVLALLARNWLEASKQQIGKRIFWKKSTKPSPNYIASTLFVSNFVGIVFARTLHYQFYAWYFHSLPYLMWSCGVYPVILRLGLIGMIESSFLAFPSTPMSSALLQLGHLSILCSLFKPPRVSIEEKHE
jgi:alpha-1,3-mannosyltransferase